MSSAINQQMDHVKEEEKVSWPERTSWWNDPILLLPLALAFGLDQVTKAIVRANLFLGESIPRDGLVRITHTSNTGSAFGLFPDQTLFLIVASLVGIGVLLLVYKRQPFSGFPLRLSLGMQLGGAAGNLFDRVRMGEVTDFIDLGPWPVFNIADASIVIGIFILGYLFLTTRKAAERTPVDMAEALSLHGPVSALDPSETANEPCLVCGAAVVDAPGGWRCTNCGGREWMDEE